MTHSQRDAPLATDTHRYSLDTSEHPVGSLANPETVRVRDAEIRVYNQDYESDSDDASDMYVMEVFGLSLLIRVRKGDLNDRDNPDAPFVHIDNEHRESCTLSVEVCNSEATEYQI